MSETPRQKVIGQFSQIKTVLDSGQLVAEADIRLQIPRNNEQVIFLNLISNINAVAGNLIPKPPLSGVDFYNRNRDFKIINDPYSALLGTVALETLFDANIRFARFRYDHPEFEAQSDAEQETMSLAFQRKHAGIVSGKLDHTRTQNGFYFTFNRPLKPQISEQLPRISFSLDPLARLRVLDHLLQGISEYLRYCPDLYLSFKFFTPEQIGFGEDLHMYFNPEQEEQMFDLLSQHIYPQLEQLLLPGGRALMLPIKDKYRYQMRGVQFGQATRGMPTSGTITMLQSYFDTYAFPVYDQLVDEVKQDGYRLLTEDPDYQRVVEQVIDKITENEKRHSDNLLVPVDFKDRFPTFYKKTRFSEITPVK